jgi:Domain of unknown function (DUF4342)
MTQYNPDVPPGPEYRSGYDPNIPPGTVYREERQVQGTDLVATMKTLIHEGYVRRVIIRQGDHTIAQFPLTVGIVGALLAPWLAAAGAIGALVANCTIEIVRSDHP